jgi:hypothetical protein
MHVVRVLLCAATPGVGPFSDNMVVKVSGVVGRLRHATASNAWQNTQCSETLSQCGVDAMA